MTIREPLIFATPRDIRAEAATAHSVLMETMLDRALDSYQALSDEAAEAHCDVRRLRLELEARPATDGYRRRFHLAMGLATALLASWMAYGCYLAVRG